MVNVSFVLRSYVVPIMVNALVTLFLVGWVYVYRMQPLFDKLTAKLAEAERAVKTGMSAMGAKSGQVRLDATVEKAVASDMLNAQLPEAEFFLNLLSADTRELVEDNPEAILRLVAKYFPDKLRNVGQQQPQVQYDL